MKVFKFLRKKYGTELLMDIGTYNDIPEYFFESVLHKTDFYEIIVFTRGNGYLELDQQKVVVTNNTVIFISPFQKRKWFVDKSGISCHFLFFQDSFLSKFFSDKLFTYRLQYFYNKTQPLFIKINKPHLEQLQNMFEEILTEVREFRSDSEHIIRALLYFILNKLNRLYSQSFQLSAETENNITAFEFKQLLQNDIQMNRTVDHYAAKIGVSRVTLNKHIKRQFGITASGMINEFMLFEIKSRILYSGLNISEIARSLNFSEANHLSRYFKNHTGYSPKEFRLAYQNGISLA